MAKALSSLRQVTSIKVGGRRVSGMDQEFASTQTAPCTKEVGLKGSGLRAPLSA